MRNQVENDLAYGFVRQLEDLTFEQAVDQVTAALKSQGFGLLTRIDVKDTLAQKLGVEFRRYVILGACNPSLAHQALQVEPQIGLLLPCNVVVQETPAGRGITISIADPRSMALLAHNPALKPVVEDAERRIRQVIANLA